ncbi:MAG: hypothetical protein ACMUIM_08990 [bacterium]
MRKRILFLFSLIFIFYPVPVVANMGPDLKTYLPMIHISLIPLMAFVEAFVFWILIGFLYNTWTRRLHKRTRFRFKKIWLATMFATSITTLYWILLKFSGMVGFMPDALDSLIKRLGMSFLLIVLMEWGIYLLFFQKHLHRRLSRIFAFLNISFIANLSSYALLFCLIWLSLFFVPERSKIHQTAKALDSYLEILLFNYYNAHFTTVSEAVSNLGAIRNIEEAHYAEEGYYLPCKPSPPNGGTDNWPDPWVDAGGFSVVGFEPSQRYLYYQYAVTVSEDRQSFKATAVGDRDKDGIPAVYTATNASYGVDHPPLGEY